MMKIRSGEEITMRKERKLHLLPENFRSMEWFRPPGVDIDDGFNSTKAVYKIEKELNLLNLGTISARESTLNATSLTKEDLNPDEQYSSHAANKKVHEAILEAKYFENYDGTIVSTATTEDDLLYDLEGAEEIVLFTGRAKESISLCRYEG